MDSDPEGVEEFRRLWKEHYGKEISVDEAKEYSERLVKFVEILTRSQDT